MHIIDFASNSTPSILLSATISTSGLVFFGGGELAEDEKHPGASVDADVVDIWSVDKKEWLPPARSDKL